MNIIQCEGWHVFIDDQDSKERLTVPVVFWLVNGGGRLVGLIPAPNGETADIFPASLLGGVYNGAADNRQFDPVDLSRYTFRGYGVGEASPMGDQVVAAASLWGQVEIDEE